MADAQTLRTAIISCAAAATAAHPDDPDARMAAFVCKLYGRMFSMGELDTEDALWSMMLTTPPSAASLSLAACPESA
jgi:hypothetical protein